MFGAGALPAGALPAETGRFCSLIARASHSNTTSVRPSPINTIGNGRGLQRDYVLERTLISHDHSASSSSPGAIISVDQ
jgi:hypothetical protein